MLNDSIMLKEIFDQKNLLKVTEETNKDMLVQVANTIKEYKPKHVLLVARGTSYHSGEYFKQLIELHLGIPVSVAAISNFTIYDKTINLEDTLVLGISQSGKGRDIRKVLEKAKEQNALVVTITNVEDSVVAKEAHFNLNTNLGKCEAYAATKSYMATMYLIDRLMYLLTNKEELNVNIDEVIKRVEYGLTFDKEVNEFVKDLQHIDDAYVMARGLDVTLALELALKMKETSKLHASSYSISEFYHGPLVMNMHNVANIVIATSKVTNKDALEVLKVFNDYEAYSFVITNNKEVKNTATKGIYFEEDNELYAKYTAIVILQLYSNLLAVLRGNNTDKELKFKIVDTY